MLIEEIILLLIMLMSLINHLYLGSHNLYDDLLESGWQSEPYIKSDKISQDVEFDYEVVDSKRDIDFNIEPTHMGRIKSINMIGANGALLNKQDLYIPPGMSFEEAMEDLKRQVYDDYYRQRRIE